MSGPGWTAFKASFGWHMGTVAASIIAAIPGLIGLAMIIALIVVIALSQPV
jgi:hypothetical protein